MAARVRAEAVERKVAMGNNSLHGMEPKGQM